jgi:hypothetical protein
MKHELSRKWIFIGLLHLGLVSAGAAQLTVAETPVLGHALQYYSDLSGAGSGYGFFSPGVYGQLRTLIDVDDGAGRVTTNLLTVGPNREADLRLNDIGEQFLNMFKDKKKFQRALAASFAGFAFANNQVAHKVTVRLEQYMAPSRQSYLAGKRADWNPVYKVSFVHKPRAEQR